MDRSQLAIIIPAFNEEATIASVVEKAAPFGNVIVVNDGSTDRTGALAARAGAHVVNNPVNRGYDRTLEAGFHAAHELGFKAVITMDADGEHAPHMLEGFVQALVDQNVPLVLGVRQRKQRLAEILMGWAIRWRYGVKDILCGMKGYHVRLYVENNGFDHVDSVGTELALSSIRRSCPFHQLGVWGQPRRDRPRFGSVVSSNLRIFRALFQVLKIRPQSCLPWVPERQGQPLEIKE